MVQMSEFAVLMLGAIADGGAVIIVLVASLVVVTVLVVVFSVTIGSLVVSSCAYAAVVKNNIMKAANIFLNIVFALVYD